MGYETTFLENGMRGWNTLHQESEVLNDGDLFVTQIIRPGKGCLSYIIGSNSTKEVFVVDPSHFIEEYIELIKEKGYTLKGVIETHVHADHISGAKRLADSTNTKYYVSGKDIKANFDFIDLQKQEKIEIGNNEIKILQTPGHTDGGVSFLLNKALLTGDTLFLEGVGRPDLGRSKEDMVYKLSDEGQIYLDDSKSISTIGQPNKAIENIINIKENIEKLDLALYNYKNYIDINEIELGKAGINTYNKQVYISDFREISNNNLRIAKNKVDGIQKRGDTTNYDLAKLSSELSILSENIK